jgi:hypothetical protein
LVSVQRAEGVIRAYGHGRTETLVATPWKDFLEDIGGKKGAATVGVV